MTAITIQELNQNRKLLHSIPEQKKIGNTFFLFCIKEWNTKIRNLLFISSFKKLPVVYLQNDENSIFDVHTPIDIKLLNRLRVNFSHLHKHKFRHNFRILLIHSAFVMSILKLSVTISWVALCFPNKERNSLKASVVLPKLC